MISLSTALPWYAAPSSSGRSAFGMRHSLRCGTLPGFGTLAARSGAVSCIWVSVRSSHSCQQLSAAVSSCQQDSDPLHRQLGICCGISCCSFSMAVALCRPGGRPGSWAASMRGAKEWYLEGGFHEENHFQKGKIGLIQCCRQCHVWWVPGHSKSAGFAGSKVSSDDSRVFADL